MLKRQRDFKLKWPKNYDPKKEHTVILRSEKQARYYGLEKHLPKENDKEIDDETKPQRR